MNAAQKHEQAHMKTAASTVNGPLLVKVGSYDEKLKDLEVSDLKEAAKVCREYIEDDGLGASDWRGGEVVLEETGLCVAVVSYNGRVWFPGGRNPEGDALPNHELEFDLGEE